MSFQQIIPIEIIIQEEMNILPSIEPTPFPFGDIESSFRITEVPGVRSNR